MQQVYNLSDTVKGTTFNGVEFTLIVNDVPKDLTQATIKVVFKHSSKTGKVSKILTTGEGITITSAVAGKFKIDSFVANMPVGIHYYDVQITIGTWVKNYITGTINILQDVS